MPARPDLLLYCDLTHLSLKISSTNGLRIPEVHCRYQILRINDLHIEATLLSNEMGPASAASSLTYRDLIKLSPWMERTRHRHTKQVELAGSIVSARFQNFAMLCKQLQDR